MKIISIHCTDGSIDGGRATLVGNFGTAGLHIDIRRDFKGAAMHVRFEGAALTAVDSERSMGKVAVGAIAGGLLLGPIGLLAGGALGSGRKHTLVLTSPDFLTYPRREMSGFRELAEAEQVEKRAWSWGPGRPILSAAADGWRNAG